MFAPEQLDALGRSAVRIATLVEMDLASGPLRLWNGAGRLTAAGAVWEGLGLAGAIDGLPQSRTLSADKVTFSLAHVDPRIAAIVANARAEITGRDVLVWFQLLDDDWQPVGARVAVWWGQMQRPVVTRTPAAEDGSHGGARVAAIEAESPFTARSRPAWGRYTDRDQQALHPGDRFFEFVTAQRSKTVHWPVFPDP